MNYADWIAVDWGTSHLRAWAMQADGSVKAEARSDDGMARMTSAQAFQPALLSLIEPWLGARPMPVLACGMIGSRQGWSEAPYIAVPAKPSALAPHRVAGTDPRVRLFIQPGLSQSKPSADVMRGEETQIAGFLADTPDFDGVICLPGTHTKWVHISAGEVVSFQTYMTGEMFDLLARQSVLRHCLAADGLAADAFDAALSETLSRPEKIAQMMFSIRAESVLAGLEPDAARARLSGLLIGAELAAAKPYWLGQNVAVVGAPLLVDLYARALESQGVFVSRSPADALTLKGLTAVYHSMSEAIA